MLGIVYIAAMNLFDLYIRDRSTLLRSINADNVNTKLKDKTTLLHICAQLDDVEVAEVLLSKRIVISYDL